MSGEARHQINISTEVDIRFFEKPINARLEDILRALDRGFGMSPAEFGAWVRCVERFPDIPPEFFRGLGKCLSAGEGTDSGNCNLCRDYLKRG